MYLFKTYFMRYENSKTFFNQNSSKITSAAVIYFQFITELGKSLHKRKQKLFQRIELLD